MGSRGCLAPWARAHRSPALLPEDRDGILPHAHYQDNQLVPLGCVPRGVFAPAVRRGLVGGSAGGAGEVAGRCRLGLIHKLNTFWNLEQVTRGSVFVCRGSIPVPGDKCGAGKQNQGEHPHELKGGERGQVADQDPNETNRAGDRSARDDNDRRFAEKNELAPHRFPIIREPRGRQHLACRGVHRMGYGAAEQVQAHRF